MANWGREISAEERKRFLGFGTSNLRNIKADKGFRCGIP